MSQAHKIVKTGMALPEFFRRYPDDAAAEKQWEAWRWPNGPQCPVCESRNVATVRERRPMPYRCRDCRRHFSVMSHTVMHASKLGAQTWLLALWYVTEHSFRYNRRNRHVLHRMAEATALMEGRRLPWKELVAAGGRAE